MVDVKWRMKRKDLLYESEVQVYALNLDGIKYLVGNEAQVWPLTWLGNGISHRNETQVCTLILIGWKMEYLFGLRLRFIPLSWSGGKWNTSLNEAQVYTLILIGRKMEYLFEWGSGLYPYPDRAKNGIPLWMRLRFVPLSWLGEKWMESSKKSPWWNLRILHNKSDRVFAKGRKMGSLKLEKGLILSVSLLRLNSFWNCLLQ